MTFVLAKLGLQRLLFGRNVGGAVIRRYVDTGGDCATCGDWWALYELDGVPACGFCAGRPQRCWMCIDVRGGGPVHVGPLHASGLCDVHEVERTR